MMRRAYLLALALVLPAAQAEVYKHVEAGSGLTVLSNVPPKSVPLQTAPRAADPVAAAAFPKVSAQRQKELDGGRRTILEHELARERQALNAARVQKAAEDIIARHNANLAALTRELSGVR